MASAAPDRVDTMTTTRPFTPDSVLDLIGRTPLLRLRRLRARTRPGRALRQGGVAEPGGSVKDRAAARDHARGRAQRPAAHGRTILDATSGNTGIAYAMIGAALGYRVKLCVPENVTPERKRILQAFGAELVLHRSDGRHRRRDPRGAAAVRRRSRTRTSTRTSTTTTPTGARTTTRPAPRSSSRPTAASRTSSPASARAARSWAPAAACASSTRRSS